MSTLRCESVLTPRIPTGMYGIANAAPVVAKAEPQYTVMSWRWTMIWASVQHTLDAYHPRVHTRRYVTGQPEIQAQRDRTARS